MPQIVVSAKSWAFLSSLNFTLDNGFWFQWIFFFWSFKGGYLFLYGILNLVASQFLDLIFFIQLGESQFSTANAFPLYLDTFLFYDNFESISLELTCSIPNYLWQGPLLLSVPQASCLVVKFYQFFCGAFSIWTYAPHRLVLMEVLI